MPRLATFGGSRGFGRGFVATAAPSYELISTTLFPGSSNSVTFNVSSLSSTYEHLQLRYAGRTARAAGTDPVLLRFNSDSGANYNSHSLSGDGFNVSATSHPTITTSILASDAIGNAIQSSARTSAAIIDILDPFSPNKNTTVRSIGGMSGSNDPRVVSLNSGQWRNTNSLTNITFFTFSGSNFLNVSRISLYGVRSS